MGTYEESGYTFTEEQLASGVNPYANSDGTARKDYGIAFFAFVAAKAEYDLEHMTPAEQEQEFVRRRHMADKMSS